MTKEHDRLQSPVPRRWSKMQRQKRCVFSTNAASKFRSKGLPHRACWTAKVTCASHKVPKSRSSDTRREATEDSSQEGLAAPLAPPRPHVWLRLAAVARRQYKHSTAATRWAVRSPAAQPHVETHNLRCSSVVDVSTHVVTVASYAIHLPPSGRTDSSVGVR